MEMANILFTVIQVIVFAVLIVLVVKLLLWIAFNIFYRLQQTKQLREFKGPPPHWFFGNIQQTKRGYGILKVMEWKAKYGPVFLIHVGPVMRALVVTSPEYIQPILNRSDPKDSNYSLFKPWIGDGLLVSSGEKWKRNRRLLTPAFHFGILKPYQCLFSQSANQMVDKWKNLVHRKPNESVEMYEHVSLMTLNSLMKCIFGIQSDLNEHESGRSHPYIRMIYIITELLSKRIRSILHRNDILYSLSSNGSELREAVSIVHEFTKSVIAERNREKAEGPQHNNSQKKYKDFLDMLLDCRDDEGNGLSPQEIQDEVDTFMFEGHDTTASAISWCLYNLAKHKDCQSKCRKEIELVLNGKREVSWDDTYNLRYLTMCIRESLRTHPPVPSIGRCMTEQVQLPNGKVIPSGTWTIVSIVACHLDPHIWPNPEHFDPERFSSDTSKRHSHAFIPFSAGARNCIGQHFAMNELKTALALILQQFELDIDESKPAEKFTELVMRSANGIWLKLTPISDVCNNSHGVIIQ